MCRNFRFIHMCHAYKSEISPHEKFSPYVWQVTYMRYDLATVICVRLYLSFLVRLCECSESGHSLPPTVMETSTQTAFTKKRGSSAPFPASIKTFIPIGFTGSISTWDGWYGKTSKHCPNYLEPTPSPLFRKIVLMIIIS